MTIGRPRGRHLVAFLLPLSGSALVGCGGSDSVAGPSEEEPETNRHRVVALVGPGRASSANDVNDAGWVVGSIGGQPALWIVDADGGVSSTEVLSGPGAVEAGGALAVNGAGTVVGWRRTDTVRPLLWSRSGGAVDLPLPPDLASGIAFGLNDAGHIVGGGAPGPEFSPTSGGRVLLWVLDADGGPPAVSDLGSFGGEGAVGRAINEHGDVAGMVWQGGEVYSFLQKGDGLEQLPLQTEALAVNGEGKVAGSWSGQAALWASGSMLAIGPVGSVARDINDADVIVGEVFGPVESGQGFGFVRTAEAIRFLEGLSTIDGTRAHGVNGSGVIVGESYVPSAGASEAVLWIPPRVP